MGRIQDHQQPPPPPFQGVSNNPLPPPPQQQPHVYPPPQPQQPPPHVYPPPQPQQQQQQQPHVYPPPAQPNVPGYAVAGHVEHQPLPCGIGIGWLLFILGFFFTIPWYIGLFLMLCPRDPREKPGLIGCAVGSIVVTSIIILVVVSG